MNFMSKFYLFIGYIMKHRLYSTKTEAISNMYNFHYFTL